MLPSSSAFRSRCGVTCTIRASPCFAVVIIPAWEPVNEIALAPSAEIAIATSALLIRSPAVSSMSISRGGGAGLTCSARSSSSSVVSPIAETTTTTSLPSLCVRTIRSATRLMRSASWTDDPPYFCTTRATADLPGFALQAPQGSPVGRSLYRSGPTGPGSPVSPDPRRQPDHDGRDQQPGQRGGAVVEQHGEHRVGRPGRGSTAPGRTCRPAGRSAPRRRWPGWPAAGSARCAAPAPRRWCSRSSAAPGPPCRRPGPSLPPPVTLPTSPRELPAPARHRARSTRSGGRAPLPALPAAGGGGYPRARGATASSLPRRGLTDRPLVAVVARAPVSS